MEFLKKTNFREDFPPLKRLINKNHPIYFDNACVSLRPEQVLRKMDEYYYEHPACAHRSAHTFGVQTTNAVENARKYIAKFLGAKNDYEIIFTKNSTEGINFVAQGLDWQKGEQVITSNLEHNSNILPWMRLSQNFGVKYLKWEITPEGEYNLDNLFAILESGKIKLLSLISSSHILPLRLPIETIIEKAHKHGTLVLVDAAQSLLHEKINLQELNCDFLVLSFHKALGPSGVGCLYVNEKHFDKLKPTFWGGETVRNVTDESFEFSPAPFCYEAGLQNYAGIMGAEAACRYLNDVGYKQIRKIDLELSERMYEIARSIDGIKMLGRKEHHGILNMYFREMDMGELSILLNRNANIMTRSGVHCGHSWYNHYGLKPSLRISLAFYNTQKELSRLEDVMKDISKYYS